MFGGSTVGRVSAPDHADRTRHEVDVPLRQNDRPLILLLALGIALGFGVETQYVAWRFAFHPNLGPPLAVPTEQSLRLFRALAVVVLGSALATGTMPKIRRWTLPLALCATYLAALGAGPMYMPHRVVIWAIANAHNPAAAAIFRVGWLVVGSESLASSALILRAWRARTRSPPSQSHGSAHWGDAAELKRASGLLLGRHNADALRYAGEGHVVTVAPTRSGKGVSCVIPNLLEHAGSVLVTDPKGENYAVTSRWRRESLRQAVHALDPFDVVGGDDAYNPLDLVQAEGAEGLDDARMLADMLVMPNDSREGEQAFWNEEARGLLTGLILHVGTTAPPELKTLLHVRRLLTLPPEEFSILLADMRASEAASGLVARAASRLLQKADKEKSGVVSTAQSHTHFLDSPRMARALGRTTVDLSALKRDEMSVYLVLPSDRLEGYARWLRLMIACALLAIGRVRGQPRRRVLFLLDEFAHLGRMQPVARDIGLAGGYGLSFWIIVQDFSQLRSTYGESWSTFLSNADVLQAFGTNDWDTAEYLSKMTGDTTIHVASENESRGVSRGRNWQSQRSSAISRAEKGRRLLFPDEVRRLPRDEQLLFAKGSAAIRASRVNYLSDAEFYGRADANPLYAEAVRDAKT